PCPPDHDADDGTVFPSPERGMAPAGRRQYAACAATWGGFRGGFFHRGSGRALSLALPLRKDQHAAVAGSGADPEQYRGADRNGAESREIRAKAPANPGKTPALRRVKKAQKPNREHFPMSSMPERMIS